MNAIPADVTIDDHYLATTLPALRPRLWAFALRLAGNRRDALELVRRTRAHAFERPDRFPTGFRRRAPSSRSCIPSGWTS